MTEQQVSIGLDRSDCRAGESMARALVGHRFRAVQQDIAVTVVDWPVVHAWNVGDPDFVGAVTILDEEGAQMAIVEWPAPTDGAADLSLNRHGWQGRVVGRGLARPPGGIGDPKDDGAARSIAPIVQAMPIRCRYSGEEIT